MTATDPVAPATAGTTPAVDAPVGTAGTTAAGTAAGTTGGSAAGDVTGGARMLDSDEIDDLGTEEPPAIEEQGVGETPTEEIEAARRRSDDPLSGGAPERTDGDEPRA